MPEIDQPAPPFEGADQSGATLALADLRGSWVVLYFYPRDQTPGCTTQACAFRDADADFQSRGARIVGVSPDTVSSHQKFVARHALPFSLVADPEHRICEAYGVWKEKNLYGKKSMGVERTTFLIDPEGIIRRIDRRVKVAGHAAAILEALEVRS